MSEPADSGARPFTISREIRAGDILQITGFVTAALLGWSAMDTRITKVEERQTRQTEVTTDIRDNIREIKNDVKEANTSVRSLESRIARKGL